jgi:hypothetical protein
VPKIEEHLFMDFRGKEITDVKINGKSCNIKFEEHRIFFSSFNLV